MTISMHQVSVPVFLRGLDNLSALIRKAAAQAAERRIDPKVLLNDRLAPDMFPFTRQVQIAADHAVRATARLAGIEVPTFEDTEQSVEDLLSRIARASDFVKGVPAERIDGSEERAISLPLRGAVRTFQGRDYLLAFALPNFYFHLTTAYAILRHNGLAIGKADFTGPVD